jgi:hypothetical protein
VYDAKRPLSTVKRELTVESGPSPRSPVPVRTDAPPQLTRDAAPIAHRRCLPPRQEARVVSRGPRGAMDAQAG